MKKALIHISMFCCIVLLTLGAVQNPFSIQYIDSLKQDSVTVMKGKDPLYQEISERATEYEQKPVDARIDKVWKAVPGYNGISVDVDKSYDKMKKLGAFDGNRLIFKETSPSVHLEDLPSSPIYRGNEQKPMVSFLVNVAWGNEYLPEMLKVMKQYEVKTTFFLDGSWVKKNPSLATMILEEGHEIGNHAYSHPDMKTLTQARIDEELQKTNDVIKATLDLTPKWFAPPSGSYSQGVVERAAAFGMNTILWSVDTVDWRKPRPDDMVTRVLSKVHNGALILMHPTEPTAAGMEKLIKGIQEKGLKIGTVSEVMDESRITSSVSEDDNRGIELDTEN
ncbi:polysaccharide deacetylase family protein [Halalkalibacter urbisdiaboli]|uniref:polysaccharide deacetylase family protein n=1 Tax=Halalkalibacter urbisdiaboli TaxID=1960589 RepID=UPI000B44F724|nr:polysaccharide deacetylase family protein [Halalkalibacter urbisdiaboli]